MIFIFVTLFIDILGLGIIVPILPELIRQFTAGSGSQAGLYYGVIIALYALMQFLFAPVLGALSDRYGRRPIILGSLFGFGVDYLVQGFAPSIGWLFVGRAIAGIMGASITTANAYIADVSTAETRARNYGFVGVAFGLGFIFGPALGGCSAASICACRSSWRRDSPSSTGCTGSSCCPSRCPPNTAVPSRGAG